MAWRNAVVVGGVTASVLALSACGGSLGGGANGPAATGGSGGGGMVAQLTFPAEVDASVGGLVNYNPLRGQAADQDLALRAADGPQQHHLQRSPLAGHQGHKWRATQQARPSTSATA